jgi:hypothetical protein
VKMKKFLKGLKINDVDTLFIKLSSISNSLEDNQNASNLDNMNIMATASNLISQNNLNNHGNNFHTSNNQYVHSTNSVNFQNDQYSNTTNNLNNFSSFNILRRKTYKIPVLSGAKIDYLAFIFGVEVISRITLCQFDPKEAIDFIIREHILRNLSEYIEKIKSSESKIEYLKELQKDNNFVYILGLVHNSFGYVFRHYADQRGLMNFNNFMK